MTNFQQIANDFLQDAGLELSLPGAVRAGAIVQLPDHTWLAPVLRRLFVDPDLRVQLGQAARERWGQNVSGVDDVVSRIAKALETQNHAGTEAAKLHREIVGARMD